MRNPPAFQFYADDFLAGTFLMSDADVGKFIRALCIQWSSGGLTDEARHKLGISSAESGTCQVAAKFSKADDGLWKNPRLEQERAKQTAFRELQSQKAQARHKLGTSSAQASYMPEACSPSPSPSSKGMRESVRACAERPSPAEVQAYAVQIGLAPWKAEDWFNEMEGCGWLDFNHRSVAKWQPLLLRVKAKWEADGRPVSPPASKFYGGLNAAQGGASSFGPSLAEVKEYAREKDDGSGRAVGNALHWYSFWEKRNWKNRAGKSIDWKVELSAHLARALEKNAA